MTAKAGRSGLLERKRQLVRQEISRAGWLLFAERGYEATTVDAIARAAGVSRRSFFRYFSSKEDVAVGLSDALADDFLAAFEARPVHEPPIVSIQHALRPVLAARLADVEEGRAIIRLLRVSRTVRRAVLERHARMEERLAALVARRTGANPRKDSTPALVAFVARALMDTAFNVWFDQKTTDVRGMIDDLFRRLRLVVDPPAARSRRPSKPPAKSKRGRR